MITEQGIARVRGVVRRRRAIVALTVAATLVASGLVLVTLEPMYRAQAVVRALESQPSHEYVAPTVAEQAGERLKTLRLALMARPLLTQVVTELRLDQADHKPAAEIVDGVRARMEVKVEGEDTFLLSYEDSDAERARQIVDRVAARFVAHQVERRAEAAAATESALAEQVSRLRPELDRLEQGVRDFKLAHYGSLPEQQEENLRTLDQTTVEINIQTTNLELQEERRRQLLLGAMSPMRHQEDLLSTALHEALTRYTPEHPEVQRIEAELGNIREARLADEKELREHTEGNPELVALGSAIDRSRALLSGLRKRQVELRARLAGTAENGQTLARLATDFDAVKGKYQGALGKLHDAQLASDLERGLKEQRYETVEGAVRPARPAHPNKALLGLGAVLLAALLGLGAGFARESMDTSIHGAAEISSIIVSAPGSGQPGHPGQADHPLEVLACVPRVDGGGA